MELITILEKTVSPGKRPLARPLFGLRLAVRVCRKDTGQMLAGRANGAKAPA